MNDIVVSALASLGTRAFLDGVKAAFSYRRMSSGSQQAREADLNEAYQLALRLLGSLLFETRANIERVRLIKTTAEESQSGTIGITFGIFDFTVSDALMPEFCRVVTAPQVLERCRSILAMLKRVDFFQREAAGNSDLYPRAVGFAVDCINKGVVDRFNELVAYGQTVASEVFQCSDLDAVRTGLLPAAIDASHRVDHSLL